MITKNVKSGLAAAIEELQAGAYVLRTRFKLNDEAADYEKLASLLEVIMNDGSISDKDKDAYTPDPFFPAMDYVYRFLTTQQKSEKDTEIFLETANQLHQWQQVGE